MATPQHNEGVLCDILLSVVTHTLVLIHDDVICLAAQQYLPQYFLVLAGQMSQTLRSEESASDAHCLTLYDEAS